MARKLTDTQWKIVHKAAYAYRNGDTSLIAGLQNKQHAKYFCEEFGFDYTANISSDDAYHWVDVDSLGTNENRIYVQNDQMNPQFGKGYFLDENNNITIVKEYNIRRTTIHPYLPYYQIVRRTPGGEIIDTQNEYFSDDKTIWKGSDEPWDLCEKLGCIPPRMFSYRQGLTQTYAHIPNVLNSFDPEQYLISIGKGI